MNDKIDKWLCENFKNKDSDVTVGSILSHCAIALFVIFVVCFFVVGLAVMIGWTARGIYLYGFAHNFTYDVLLIDGFVGAAIFVFGLICCYVLDVVLNYKVTTCRRKDGDLK